VPWLARIGTWTRDMIETALRFEGRYDLPYQLHATRAQFDRAYPEAAQLRAQACDRPCGEVFKRAVAQIPVSSPTRHHLSLTRFLGQRSKCGVVP
jgi:hypothetical protein